MLWYLHMHTLCMHCSELQNIHAGFLAEAARWAVWMRWKEREKHGIYYCLDNSIYLQILIVQNIVLKSTKYSSNSNMYNIKPITNQDSILQIQQ